MKRVSKLLPFSGSAYVDTNNSTGLLIKPDEPVILLYSSISKFLWGLIDPETDDDFLLSTVRMFYSYDGFHFDMHDKVMIEHSETIRNFRDPVVFKFYDIHYVLLLTENTKLGIYTSLDLLNWEKKSVFSYELVPFVSEWETPSMLQLHNDSLLVLGINLEPEIDGPRYSTLRYFVGEFDGFEFKANGQATEFDGPDLYGITISEDNIMMGMLNNW